jgi:hypothetical protein
LVKAPVGSTYLHYNFVVALLSDRLGIQAHWWLLVCWSLWPHALLNIDLNQSDAIVDDLERHGNAIKPGWTRLSFSYYMCDKTVDYIIQAVDLIGQDGYKLLPWYKFNTSSTMWTHIGSGSKNHQKSFPLDLWDFEQPTYAKATKIRRKHLKACLKQARNLLASIDLQSAPKNNNTNLPESTNKLRWFLLSEEVRRYSDTDRRSAARLDKIR